MTTPTLSVVALTWNSERFVEPFLKSLFADAHGSALTLEVLVVDNGSRDGTVAMLRSWVNSEPALCVLEQTKNLGTSISRNIALRQARGQYVLVLDSDTVIPPGALRGLIEEYREISRTHAIGLLCPRLVYPNGDFQESARRFPTLITKGLRLLGWERLRQWDESIPEVLEARRTRVDFGISAAWFFERRLLDSVGYLDEQIFYAPEDVEFCARVWANGYQVWYAPSVQIVHDCQRLTNKKPLSRLGASHASGLWYHWAKHGGMLRRRGGIAALHTIASAGSEVSGKT